MTSRAKPAVLIILDGWGYSEDEQFNAIKAASTPVWDRLWREYPHTLIRTSGAEVGLPAGQMGNSEVGHLNLGAGRVVYQEYTRISRSVRTGSFYSNRTLTDGVDQAVARDGAIHIFGLLSPGGVHSHEEHIHAMAKLAVERGAKRVYMHAFLDGRDTPPRSAKPSLELMDKIFAELGTGRIASIAGRFYAMDRDRRWDRVEQAYDMLTLGQGAYQAVDAVTALEESYARDEADEFVKPTCIVPEGEQPVKVEDGDAVFFMNYRSDRARELTQSFIDDGFDGFERKARPALTTFISLTEYNKDFDIPIAFPPERLKNVFGEYISNLGLRQLRVAETEKYAHVTFFFNGGREEVFEGEERILVPSPRVDTYDMMPEMSAPEVTDNLAQAIEDEKYDAIICNYANSDMVGHTGDFDAAVKAIETLDHCLGRVVAALHRVGGELLITADHGNAEQMQDPANSQAHTAHTNNPVPLVYVGRKAELLENGALCDIAPTLLEIMDLPIPSEMNGHSLVKFPDDGEEAA
ncbi:MAG: 2,3-bisphosphoglycerate-independent phosphoglycerate mutase [Chromatiales bacterium]|nr:2,3-bisphosphoglycerate-independent phosphoglycerate mutase [Chromatiales bacterium]